MGIVTPCVHIEYYFRNLWESFELFPFPDVKGLVRGGHTHLMSEGRLGWIELIDCGFCWEVGGLRECLLLGFVLYHRNISE